MGRDGLELLLPGTDSLTRLLRAEGRSLDQYSVCFLVELLCALVLGEGSETHIVVPRALAPSEAKDYAFRCYEVEEETLEWVGGVVPPSITPLEPLFGGGWQVRFSTVIRRQGRAAELGTEEVVVWPEFTFSHNQRELFATKSSTSEAPAYTNFGRVDEPYDIE